MQNVDQSSSPKEHSASQLLEVGQLNTQVGKIYVLIDKGKRKSLGLLGALCFEDRSEELRAHASHPTSLQACSPCITIKPGSFDDCTGG